MAWCPTVWRDVPGKLAVGAGARSDQILGALRDKRRKNVVDKEPNSKSCCQ